MTGYEVCSSMILAQHVCAGLEDYCDEVRITRKKMEMVFTFYGKECVVTKNKNGFEVSYFKSGQIMPISMKTAAEVNSMLKALIEDKHD
jgi:hypothetical protein